MLDLRRFEGITLRFLAAFSSGKGGSAKRGNVSTKARRS